MGHLKTAFQNCNQLQFLDLNTMRASTSWIMPELKSLSTLDLTNTKMINFTSLTSQPMLRSLVLDGNNFKTVNFSTFPQMPRLEILSMRNCRIVSIVSNLGVWNLMALRLTAIDLRY